MDREGTLLRDIAFGSVSIIPGRQMIQSLRSLSLVVKK